jgi:molybdate transport system substrate-binding protein
MERPEIRTGVLRTGARHRTHGLPAPGYAARRMNFTGTKAVAAFGLALFFAGCSRPKPASRHVTVAAAADLSAAFTELGGTFEKKTAIRPIFTFGSTGLLAKQLDQGAPFDVFAAANVSFVEQVVKSGACDGATKSMYARGRLVVWTRSGATVEPPKTLAELGDVRFVHVAIANPEHAPYGRAAEDALAHADALDLVKPKLVFGENVQQAFELARTGNADAAIVALSLAIAKHDGVSLPVDPTLHAPIDQAMVVCRRGQDEAAGKAFSDFLGSKEGRTVMQAYGFVLPGEAVAATP